MDVRDPRGGRAGIRGAADSAERAARGAAHEAAPWIERLARFGYAAKGAVYVLVGVLAVSAAMGDGGAASGSSGALASIADSSWGRLLLGLIAVGLFGYVLWRAVGAALNPENEGTGRRVFFAISGVVYAGLAIEAARLALSNGGGGSGSDGGASHWTATVMEQPMGQVLVAIAGIALALYGLKQLHSGYVTDIDDRLDLSSMSPEARGWTVRFGRAGMIARGIVLAIMGGFVLVSAIQQQPEEARGLGGALRTLQEQPYGPWILLLVALGLIAYGLYNFVRARYRRIRAE